MSRKFEFLSPMDKRVLGIISSHPMKAATSVTIANKIGSCTDYSRIYLRRLEQKGLIELNNKDTYPFVWRVNESISNPEK